MGCIMSKKINRDILYKSNIGSNLESDLESDLESNLESDLESNLELDLESNSEFKKLLDNSDNSSYK